MSTVEFSAMRNMVTHGDTELKTANNLVEDFLKWANSNPRAGAEDAAFDGMLLQLEKIKFNVLKTDMIVAMNTREAGNYATATGEIEKKIAQSHTDIGKSKHDLVEAQGVRKHREEYDALATPIQKTASRQDTLKNIVDVETALTQLAGESADLESQLQTRQRQYALLLHSLRDILESVDGSEDNTGDGEDADAEAAAKEDSTPKEREASEMDTN